MELVDGGPAHRARTRNLDGTSLAHWAAIVVLGGAGAILFSWLTGVSALRGPLSRAMKANTALCLTDRSDLFGLPFATIVRVNKPKLRRQRRCGESVVVLVAPSPADFERRARDLEYLFRLARMEIPHHHG